MRLLTKFFDRLLFLQPVFSSAVTVHGGPGPQERTAGTIGLEQVSLQAR